MSQRRDAPGGAGVVFSRSTMFSSIASKRASLELAGWPSTKLSGFTYATAGNWPLSRAAKKSIASLMCSPRCVASPMIELA